MKPPFIVIGALGALVLTLGGITSADVSRATITKVDAILTANPIGADTAKFTHLGVRNGVIVEVGEVRNARWHTHQLEDHLFYVVRGRATARLGPETRELGPGDLVSIPRGTPHAMEQVGTEPFVVLAIVADGWDAKTDTEVPE